MSPKCDLKVFTKHLLFDRIQTLNTICLIMGRSWNATLLFQPASQLCCLPYQSLESTLHKFSSEVSKDFKFQKRWLLLMFPNTITFYPFDLVTRSFWVPTLDFYLCLTSPCLIFIFITWLLSPFLMFVELCRLGGILDCYLLSYFLELLSLPHPDFPGILARLTFIF